MGMDWKGLVGQVAPMIGTALGGPLGGLAVQAIGSALGLDQKTEDAVKQAIAGATPEQMIAIKNADNDFKLKMTALGFDHEDKIAALNAQAAELDVKDRQGARDMQAATKSITVPVLAYVIVVSFIAMIASTLAGYSHVDGALAGSLVGYLSAKCEQVVAYYFGSSRGSQQKDILLANSKPAD
jgi:hypothetical protein